MTGFHHKDSIMLVDNVPLPDIAQEVGTPAYVYSAQHIRSQYQSLSSAMQKALPADKQPMLCYACKANSNLAVLSVLRGVGSGLEIVSEGELHRGIKAGFDPARIVSTGVGKQDSEIIACLKAGIHQLNVESLPELERIHQLAAEIDITAPVVFRLNPDVSGGGHHKISTGRKGDKFGLGREDVLKGFAMAAEMSHVKALGLSMHIGSQVFTVETFKTAFEVLPAIVGEIRNAGYTVDRLDIGGGFPIRYDDENLLDLQAYADWVRDIILPLETEIIMEPGRFLVGNAGVLLTRVLYVKEAQGQKFLVLDGAMNDLIRPTLYDAYHGIEPVANPDAPLTTYDIVGPVCETGDTFASARNLPTMKQGDLAVIKTAGAYGFCMASNYNTRPMPPEILVDGDQWHIIRPRQTYDDLLGRDSIPHWLAS